MGSDKFSNLLTINKIVLKWIRRKFGNVKELRGSHISDQGLVKRYVSNLYYVLDQTSKTALIELFIETKSIDKIVNLIIQRIHNNYYRRLLDKYDKITILIVLFDLTYTDNIEKLIDTGDHSDFNDENIEIYVGSVFRLLNDELSNFEYHESFRVYLDT